MSKILNLLCRLNAIQIKLFLDVGGGRYVSQSFPAGEKKIKEFRKQENSTIN